MQTSYLQKSEYWYNKNTNKKILIRDSFLTTLSLSSDKSLLPKSNDFELKLILNPDFSIEDDKKVKNFNQNFIKLVKDLNFKFKSFETSSILPFAWFYFDNELERENFIKKTINLKEISRFIVFKNENANQNDLKRIRNDYYSEPDTEPTGYSYPKEYKYKNQNTDLDFFPHQDGDKFKESIDKNISIVKFDKEQKRIGALPIKDYEWIPTYKGFPLTKTVSKYPMPQEIGVLEFAKSKLIFDKKFESYFANHKIDFFNPDKKEIVSEKGESHATLVSMIAAGKYGVDRDSKVFLAFFDTDGGWQKALEEMVLNQGIKVINHSYGSNLSDEHDYDDNAYFLDFLARKYGVINVFSAGNGAKPNGRNPWINSHKLSLNTIVVGSLGKQSDPSNLAYNKIAHYSNYQLKDSLSELAKPLVVAPGYFYDPTQKKVNSGTSFSAPLVTGLISALLQNSDYNPSLDFNVPAIKSILSAAAVSPKLDNLNYKPSGYERKMGAGTVNYENMLLAAKNLVTFTVSTSQKPGNVYTSRDISLKTGQKIKIASSWFFNPGLLKGRELKTLNDLYGYADYYGISESFVHHVNKLTLQSNDQLNQKNYPQWLRHKEELLKENKTWFTDFDLVLEKKTKNGEWEKVKKILATLTNDELIEYKTDEDGIFRFRIEKYNNLNLEEQMDDKIAVTYLVHNDE